MKTAPAHYPRLLAVLALSALLVDATWVQAQQSWPGQMWTWLGGQLATAGRQMTVNNIFPTPIANSINSSVSAYGKLYDLTINIGMGGLRKEMQGDLTPSNNFNNDLSNWVSNALLPQYMQNIIPNSYSLMDYAGQKVAGIESGIDNFTNQVDQRVNDLKSYFSGNDGLDPGSPEAAVAHTANLGSPNNVASSLESDYGADQTQARQMANSTQEADIGRVAATQLGATGTDADASGPPTPPPGPNSELDPNYASVTVSPLSMQSTDPNSCIKTSNSLGVGSVSIDCNVDQPSPIPTQEEDFDAQLAGAGASADASYTKNFNDALNNNTDVNAQLGAATQKAADPSIRSGAIVTGLSSLAQGLGPIQPGTRAQVLNGTGQCGAAAAAAFSRCEAMSTKSSMCQMYRSTASCENFAAASCGGCSSCIQQLQAAARQNLASAAQVCANP